MQDGRDFHLIRAAAAKNHDTGADRHIDYYGSVVEGALDLGEEEAWVSVCETRLIMTGDPPGEYGFRAGSGSEGDRANNKVQTDKY